MNQTIYSPHHCENKTCKRIGILETELRNEQSRSGVDMSTVDSKMKGEYEAMLKRELKNLRKLYKANMKQSQEEYMRTYNQKVRRGYEKDPFIFKIVTLYNPWHSCELSNLDTKSNARPKIKFYNKLGDLERALAHEKSHNSGAVVEARELRIRVEVTEVTDDT